MLLRTTSRHSGEKIYLRKFWLIIISLAFISIQIYAQNGWTRKADIPKGGGSASVVNNKIYVFGGSASVSISDVAFNEVYDPLTNTWEDKALVPTPRGFLTSAVVDGKIYVIGGGYPTSTNKNEVYDPATNSWTTKKNMLSPRLGMRAGVVDGIIYTIGGNYNQRNCQAFDPNTNTWTEKTPIPVGGGGVLSVTVYNGLIYTFGGSTYSPWGALASVHTYNPQTDIWTPKKVMPTPRFGFQTYLVNGKIYAIGGSQSESTALAIVEVYDPVTDTWDTKPNMPHNCAWCSGAVVNDKIYVISGTQNFSTVTTEVWEYDPEYVIPVELTSFTASANGKEVTLSWTTASELNNKGFEVQRKFGFNDFVTIGSVSGHGTTTSPNQYTFVDKLIDGGKYFYRLKQIDYGGICEYSDEIEVDIRVLDKFTLEQNYPNPFNPVTTIGYVLQENSNAKLTILNTIGEEMAVLVNEEQDKGYHKVEFTASNLASGIYFYQLKTGSLIETKKMILLR